MSASGGARGLMKAPAFRLQYVVTSDEVSKVARQAVKAHEIRWLHWVAIVGAICMAVHCATMGYWSGSAVFGTAAITALRRYPTPVLAFVFSGEICHDLIVDPQGIRGTVESRLRFKRWSTTTQLEYEWPQLKSIMRLGDYLLLKFGRQKRLAFNFAGATIIPLATFANPGDLRQFEAWAESGLARQPKKAD